MSKVKTHLINLNLKAGNLKLAVKLALLNNLEGANSVYLDNAYSDVKSHVTPHQFAGFLSALTIEGFYRPTSDKHFGEVIAQTEKE